MINNKRVCLLISLLFFASCAKNHRMKLGNDYDLFRNSPIADLAEAAGGQDSFKIEQLSKELSNNINCQVPTFGQTLLMVSTQNENVVVC